jgi:hypothetical protein
MRIAIPPEFRDTPEAERLRRAEERFEAAAKGERTRKGAARIRFIGEALRAAQNELQAAVAAFDATTGQPKPVGLTPKVVEEVARLFPPEQRAEIEELLDRKCGRTIPFKREASASELEYVRLKVLRLSNGTASELRKWIELANIDVRDLPYAPG